MTRRLDSLTLTFFALLAVACADAPLTPAEASDPSAPTQGGHDTSAPVSSNPTQDSVDEAHAGGAVEELQPGGAAEEASDDEEGGEELPSEPVEAPENTLEVIDSVLAVEGPQVIPQTMLHLESEVANCDGQAIAYEWSVTQPEGSVSVFLPSSAHPTPTFEANVAGEYSFELQSFGQDGTLCTTPHRFMLAVLPNTALHIELLWHTPGDPDETDEGPEAGADLDLHMARVWADDEEAAWFNVPFDCFWFNANPNWGSLDPMVDDDPSLDRDDTDGAGPENLNLNITEEDASYEIMVNVWSDHGFGESLATVRIYVMGALVYEKANVSLMHNDGWEVGTLDSALTFTPAEDDEGEPVIIEDFTVENPF